MKYYGETMKKMNDNCIPRRGSDVLLCLNLNSTFMKKLSLIVLMLSIFNITYADSWQYVGTAGFVNYTCLAFDTDGQLYVAYSDGGNSYKATVMKFNGTSWVNIGNAGFSNGDVVYTDLVISPAGQPYIAYEDNGNGNEATVMKFDGNNWVDIGSGGLSDGIAWFTRLAFGPTGQPYVAYRDVENTSKATVRKFDGISWVNIGIPEFSAGHVWYVSLAFNPSGQPYVAYSDEANSFKATVMMFDGTNWLNVGTAGFSAGSAYNTCLAFNPSGQPYVAYSDWGYSEKASVMKYGSPSDIPEKQNTIISVYPDPTSTLLTIDLKTISNVMKSIEVYDLTGKKMFEAQSQDDKIILNVEDYPVGFYFIRLKTNTLNYTGKFCKN